MEKNIVRHQYKILREDREKLLNQKGMLAFFTGLSGSGKSTIANGVEQDLHTKGYKTYVLDGDNIRSGINQDLTFSPEDRSENIRRIAEVSKLFVDAGIVVIAAFVAPYEADREFIRKTVGADSYFEVFVNTSLEECERRDVKGLYAKARSGEIKNMTGISAPYESPSSPNIEMNESFTIQESIDLVVNALKPKINY
ncbi:adenylyl-sulfate kinase [Aureicoccus marinus]|uniref:Adenylyl-sulfate kinase n=1 Tax=Aureicoccus marinus TaxID=754435 RepID=A0A2S7T5P9_9FLAO|nr:adenylyl-sulfate kinase [Aureicoccus marinus]PQJ15249.1 adenylyl-sulfate kinase [Aureicoccus marinus]